MSVDLKGRSFLKILDFSKEELVYLLDLAIEFKNLKNKGLTHRYLEGKNMVLIFEKTSTRTRGAFEVAGKDLGMGVTYIGPGSSQMGHKESIKDTARVFGRYYDCIEYRGFDQSVVEDLAEYSGVPVYNGLTNQAHPTQALADLMTIKENFTDLAGLNLTYFGDARNNVADSLMVAAVKLGINYTACGPKSLHPQGEILEKSQKIAKENGSQIRLTENVDQAASGAHILYTDVWVSMGEADEIWEERIGLLEDYRISQEVMDLASDQAIFLHCLPAFHNTETGVGADIAEKFEVSEMEVTNQVFESEASKVFDQAENRMHTIKAIIYASLAG